MKTFFLCVLFSLSTLSAASAGFIGYYAGTPSADRISAITGVDPLVTLQPIDLNYSVVPSYVGFDYPYYLVNWATDGALQMSGTVTYEGVNDPLFYTIHVGPGFKLYEWGEDPNEWTTYNLCKPASGASLYGTTVVPEPSSILLVAVGFGLIAFRHLTRVKTWGSV